MGPSKTVLGRFAPGFGVRASEGLYRHAQVAVRHEPRVKAFYEKLLRAIYDMRKHGQDFDGTKFYHPPNAAPAA